MRMLMDVIMPVGKFNEAVRNGSAGRIIEEILEETKPEAVYFTERGGHRGATIVVEVADPSRVPALAEPWFLHFDAEVHFRIVMVPEDLKKADLEALGRRWSRQPAAV